jgi:hypothetical protein
MRVLSVVLLVAAVALARAVLTRHGVGAGEYAVSALLIALFVRTALLAARR